LKKPGAVALLERSWKELSRLGKILGIFQEDPIAYIENEKRRGLEILGIDEKELEQKISERAKARAEKNFELADAIRSELAQKGIVLEDTRGGTEWKIDRKKLREKISNPEEKK